MAHMFLKIKNKANGDFDKIKARLVAGGDGQTEDTYDTTFSPTVNPVTIFSLINVMTVLKLECIVVDVKAAFLNAKVEAGDPEIYVSLTKNVADIWIDEYPEHSSFRSKTGLMYFRLGSYMYGLKQSSHKFNQLMDRVLREMDFQQSAADECLYTKPASGYLVIVAIHVDDLIVMAPSAADVAAFQTQIGRYFEVNIQQGQQLSYLGLSIIRGSQRTQTVVSQEGYLKELIEKHGKPVFRKRTTPVDMDIASKRPETEPPPCDRKLFLSIVMALMYLARFTRADILFAVTYLATRCEHPTTSDLTQAYNIIAYLQSTPMLVYVFFAQTPLTLSVYVDASHGLHADGKGHSGIVVTLGSAPIVQRSSKQRTQALSSTEAETLAVGDALTYILWFRVLFAELGFDLAMPVPVYQDNQSAIILYNGGGTFRRSKHMVIQRSFIRDLVQRHTVSFPYLSTDSHPADILTKPVSTPTLLRMLQRLCILPSQPATR
jgi:hypothetical protein